jgi:hypothetical protein
MTRRSAFSLGALVTALAFLGACGETKPLVNPGGSSGGNGEVTGTGGGPGGAGADPGATGGGPGGSGGQGGAGGGGATPGKTDFTSEDLGGPGAPGSAADVKAGGTAPGDNVPTLTPSPEAPGGRVAEVEEGDIYKMVGNRLYYLNTYRGFIVYDLTNPKAPARLSRLPVFGYPVEMYVEGNTVYALLRDALYLTQVNGKLEFARHNVSQLVTIDISDPTKPRVIKTLDIIGQLREGVSRKVENTIYVVSYWNRSYWWGWAYERTDPNRQDQAWVYSFDIADRANPKKTGELKVFEGGAISFHDKATGASFNRSFSGVSISATSNALMVVENWSIYASAGTVPGSMGCGYYNSDQQAVVSVVDISDPKGSIRVHTSFQTPGALTDQFKQTYVHDPATGKGTYFGIFARRGWQTANCTGTSVVQNTIEAWDVTDGANPSRVGRLDFGKPNETVRGTAFDVSRNVAYAITARNIDPLYAISIADPKKLAILSAIDGLSGDVSVFRLIGDKNFLLAVGRDNSTDCTGFQDTMPAGGTNNIAVSIIDAKDLTKIRLVQRQCVNVQNAAWVNSQVTWNLDQAHKMLGMHSDGEVNVLTVPVSYWKRNENKDWWWDRYETAVGIMSWDLARYDPAANHLQQTVIQNHGTFIHPNGEVRRSVLFKHQDLKQRMMANLSDTHISIANIQDLDKPTLESVVEVAPYLNELFRFGDHIVEQVQPRTGGGAWNPSRNAVEYRVRKAGGMIDDRAPVATFLVGQVQRAVKHGNQLVVFRYVPATTATTNAAGVTIPATPAFSEAVVYDLTNPAAPRLAGKAPVPYDAFPYYAFYCGTYFGGYWFDRNSSTSWVDTAAGLVVARPVWNSQTQKQTWKMLFLDLRSPDAPVVTDKDLDLGTNSYFSGLTVDAPGGTGLYLGYRTYVGQATRSNGSVYSVYRDFAARWELTAAAGWAQRSTLNIPGRLLNTWVNAAGERLLTTSDTVWSQVTNPTTNTTTSHTWTRLNLLRETNQAGMPAAELLDGKVFESLYLGSLVADAQRLFVVGRRTATAATTGMTVDSSDRLMALDLSGNKLNLVYDQSMRTSNVRLMGVHDGRLFANLPGDGILIADVADAAKPLGLHFTRTLGYATHIEFAGDDAYVGSGYFGTTHIDLKAAASLLPES